MNTLLSYQIDPANHHLDVLSKYDSTVEASGTGFGKMYVGSAVAAMLGKPLFVVCPKAIMDEWEEVAHGFGVKNVEVINYEKLRYGNTKWGKWKTKTKNTFLWNVDPDALIIFDECQVTKGRKSLNGKMLRAAKDLPNKLMLMSATMAISPLDMLSTGYVLDLHKGQSDYFWWCRSNGCYQGPFGLMFNRDPKVMKKLHSQIFPHRGHRIRVQDVPGFPENQVSLLPVDAGKVELREIQEVLDEIDAKRDTDAPLPVVDLLRLRQKLEMVKAVAMVEHAKDLVAEDLAVVFFVNFTTTYDYVVGALEKANISNVGIDGRSSPQQDKESKRAFQANEVDAFVCNLQAGGVGLSLHDLHGKPRVALISPSYSAETFIQAIGRICRSGAKSPAIQHVMYVQGTVEERIRKSIGRKIKCLDALNDGDMSLMDGEEDSYSLLETQNQEQLMNYEEEDKVFNKPKGLTGAWEDILSEL